MALLLFLSLALAADTHVEKILSLSNDRDSKITEIELDVDASGAVKALRWKGGKTKTFTVAQLADFQVVEAQKGVDAMLIKANIGTESGDVTIKFVYNGIFRSYRECSFKLTKEKVWKAPVDVGRIVTRAIGIVKIEGICPQN
jgi:hypothetical protein